MVTLTNNNQIYASFDNQAELLLNILFLGSKNSIDLLIDFPNNKVFFDGMDFDIKEVASNDA